MTLIRTFALATTLLISSLFPAYANPAAVHFQTEQEAKQHCPKRHGCLGEYEDRGLPPEG